MLAPVLSTAATVKPLTVDEAKAHLRIDHDDEDAMVGALIDAAVSHVDGYTGILGRALLTQTWRQDFGQFGDRMRLRVGDVISITSVTYYDQDNAQQTLASTVYTTLTDEIGAFLTRKPDQDWPSVYDRPDAVRVTWSAGYGAAAVNVPMAIRQALLLLIGHWYENREAVSATSMSEMPMAVMSLLRPYRRIRI